MRSDPKECRALGKLLALANIRAEELTRHITDLESAAALTLKSLLWLDGAVREESGGDDLGPAAKFIDLARYLEGTEAKRVALEATSRTIETEIVVARDQLAEIFAEIKKLEHLIEVSRRAELRYQRKQDLTLLDAAVRRRTSEIAP